MKSDLFEIHVIVRIVRISPHKRLLQCVRNRNIADRGSLEAKHAFGHACAI